MSGTHAADREQHGIRTRKGVWAAALARARHEGYKGLAEVIESWLEAYAAGRLDAMPGGYQVDPASPAPGGGTLP